MKTEHIPEAFFVSRLAPYVLALAVLGFAVSLLWIRPQPGYLSLGVLSGSLLSLFHVLKWRTGREGFQFAAMAATFLPLLVVFHAHLSTGSMCQYLALFVSAYAGVLMVLRRRILTWIRP